MKRFIAVGVGSTALALGVSVAPIAATATAAANAATSIMNSAATTAAPIAIAGEGRDGALWVQAPQLSGGWHSLGGKIIAPPAVVAVPSTDGSTPMQPLFIAMGTDHLLWMRSLTTGWQQLGNAPTCDSGPAAAVVNSRLTVACRGLYNELWQNSTATWSSGLPVFMTIATSQGGVLAAAPAVASIHGTTTYFVLGTNGEIYISPGSGAYSATHWHCIGQPAASLATSGEAIFACQGTDHRFWESTSYDVGTKWTKLVSLGGSLIGTPAIAATSSVPELLIEGSNHAVWVRTTKTPWTSIGGYVVGGVAAAVLG